MFGIETITDAFGDAYDYVTNIFEPEVKPSYTPSYSSPSGTTQYPDFNLGGGYEYSLNPDTPISTVGSDALDYVSNLSDTSSSSTPSWYQNPAIVSAAITGGAALLQNLSSMNQRDQELAANKEAQKLKNLIELAKLKYELQGKGAGGGGVRRGGSSVNPAQAINSQFGANQAAAYQNLGGNLASIYRT